MSSRGAIPFLPRYPLADIPRLNDYLAAHDEDAGTVARVRPYRRRGCRAIGDGGGVPADRE